ncbi:MAG: glycerate kinase, partial [Lentisphaerae bacterium]|nr:glycerate kinase [Lentisphaerota bacterium]
PGSGAAGGLGAGLMAFAGGTLRPGVDMVMETVGLERRLKGCDLVITGEGRLDAQACYGKAPAGVARVARALKLPVIAIAGSVGADAQAVTSVGIDAYVSALQELMDEGDLPERGAAMLEDCAEQVGRLLRLGKEIRNV